MFKLVLASREGPPSTARSVEAMEESMDWENEADDEKIADAGETLTAKYSAQS